VQGIADGVRGGCCSFCCVRVRALACACVRACVREWVRERARACVSALGWWLVGWVRGIDGYTRTLYWCLRSKSQRTGGCCCQLLSRYSRTAESPSPGPLRCALGPRRWLSALKCMCMRDGHGVQSLACAFGSGGHRPDRMARRAPRVCRQHLPPEPRTGRATLPNLRTNRRTPASPTQCRRLRRRTRGTRRFCALNCFAPEPPHGIGRRGRARQGLPCRPVAGRISERRSFGCRMARSRSRRCSVAATSQLYGLGRSRIIRTCETAMRTHSGKMLEAYEGQAGGQCRPLYRHAPEQLQP